MKNHPSVLFYSSIVVSGVLALSLGNFKPQMVPDTSGYFFPYAFPDVLSQTRTPFYGLLVDVLGGSGNGFVFVPVAHALLLVLAAIVLFTAARMWGIGLASALALVLPIFFSNSVLLYLNSVHPEIPAIACILLAIAALIRLSSGGHWAWYIVFGFSLGLSYLLKPGFLFFIPVLPALYFLLMRLRGVVSIGAALKSAVFLACVGSLPFVSYASLRASQVGDFNVVSFGGLASSGLSGLMLTPTTVPKLKPEHRDLASAILGGRERLAGEGTMLPIPLNSEGKRSFVSAALGYFDVLARSYDDVVFRIVAGQRAAGESWVAFNARLQSFTLDVIRAEPINYMAWIVGAGTRIAGLITIANACFMVAFAALVILFVIRIAFVGLATARAIDPRDVSFVLLVVGAYTMSNCIPMMLLTFPARRYVDTAGLLLAALPILGILRLLAHIPKRHSE